MMKKFKVLKKISGGNFGTVYKVCMIQDKS